MSLISSLYTGASGLYTNQTAIQVTGNNITNANTTGYSRQVVTVTGTTPLQTGGLILGTGSTVSSVQRASNTFLTNQLAAENASCGEYEAMSSPLADIEQILDIGDTSLASDIDGFFDAWEELSIDPSGTAERQQVLQQGEDLANHFQQIDQRLTEVVNSVNANIESIVPELNGNLSQIAQLNQQILQTESGGGNANTLRDQRDTLVQSVCEACGATSYTDQSGMTCLQLPGGSPLVTGNTASTLTTSQINGLTNIEMTSGTATFAIDSDHVGGSLKGLLTVRDETIPDLRNSVDRLAYTLATEINSLHSTGTDANGDPASDVFSFSTSTDPLASAWTGAAGSIAVAITDPLQVATSTSGLSGDNSLTLSIASLRNQDSIENATYTDEYARIAAKAGLLASNNEQNLEASSDMKDATTTQLDSVTGVSSDEEMILLMQYQSGYQAASHYLSVVQEMLKTLMQT